MKTIAIFTRTLTTSTVSVFDLVRQGWQIVSIDIDGVITATKQQLVNCDKDAAALNMLRHNLYDSKKKHGTEIVSKIDFGVYKVGLVWNAEDRCAEAWMNRPEVNKECSKGLAFASNGDGTCTVSGIGTCTDTNIIIPSFYNGEKVTSIGDYAFASCRSLTSITIPNGVMSIGLAAFEGCTGLKRVRMPNSLTSIDYFAFENCSSLTGIHIPNGVTSIGGYAFAGCIGLQNIIIPDGVTTIRRRAFYDCSGLTDILIGNNVTNIDYEAFRGCSGLVSITVPEGVASIGERAFEGCPTIEVITMSGRHLFGAPDKIWHLVWPKCQGWHSSRA